MLAQKKKETLLSKETLYRAISYQYPKNLEKRCQKTRKKNSQIKKPPEIEYTQDVLA